MLSQYVISLLSSAIFLRVVRQLYRVYIVWGRRPIFVAFPFMTYLGSLGNHITLLQKWQGKLNSYSSRWNWDPRHHGAS